MFYHRGVLRFGYTIAYVPDVEAALGFYERAFGLPRRYITPDGTFGELEGGETALAFAALTLGEANFPGGVRPNDSDDTPAAFEIALVTGTCLRMNHRRLGAIGECETRTQGAPVLVVRGRQRTQDRAAERGQAAERFFLRQVPDNVPQAFARAIEAGARALAEPQQKPWGQTVAFVRDPYGLVVELCTPM
jgi:uncharacterized glyoxalase superfamily protein PhnB